VVAVVVHGQPQIDYVNAARLSLRQGHLPWRRALAQSARRAGIEAVQHLARHQVHDRDGALHVIGNGRADRVLRLSLCRAS
jgi:hypothetical protein